LIFSLVSLKEIASLQTVHSQLKQKLSKLNVELNQIIDKNFTKLQKFMIEKVETVSKSDFETQKGYFLIENWKFKQKKLKESLKKKIENIKKNISNAKTEYNLIKAQKTDNESLDRFFLIKFNKKLKIQSKKIYTITKSE